MPASCCNKHHAANPSQPTPSQHKAKSLSCPVMSCPSIAQEFVFLKDWAMTDLIFQI
jgi:hypothetical protein